MNQTLDDKLFVCIFLTITQFPTFRCSTAFLESIVSDQILTYCEDY